MRYLCSDYNGIDEPIEAPDPREAAREYVDSGDWEGAESWMITVSVTDLDGEVTHHQFQLDPVVEPGMTYSEVRLQTPRVELFDGIRIDRDHRDRYIETRLNWAANNLD